MPFDPTQPADSTPVSAPAMRAQLNALNDAIAAVPAGPQGPAGPPIPGLNFLGDWNGGTSYLPGDVIFHDGQAFVCITTSTATTPEGDLLRWRTLTIAGPPGEVSNAQLANAVATAVSDTSHNAAGVSALGLSVSNPPTQAEMQALAAKVDELLAALRR